MAQINAGQRVRWASNAEGVVVRMVPAYKSAKAHLREMREKVCHPFDDFRGFRRAVVEDKAGRWHIVATARLTVLPKPEKMQIPNQEGGSK